MFVETDFMGRHKRVGSNLNAPLKGDAEDTASENERTNSLLQKETLINIEKRQCIRTVPKAENSFVYKVAEPMIHFLLYTNIPVRLTHGNKLIQRIQRGF